MFPKASYIRRLVSTIYRFKFEAYADVSVAREASRRIVEDLLLTAGGGDITDSTGGMDEDSPSVVRRRPDLDDSF